MKYIFWDIDGTLLVTGLAGADALRQAIKEQFGVENFQFSHPLAGATDSQIIKQICIDIKGRCHTFDAANLLINYHRLLPQFLQQRQGRLMPNVEKTLEYFKGLEGFTTCLLTGNTTTGAYHKLKRYSIDRYFDSRYAVCGELSEERDELAKIALRRLQIYFPEQEITGSDIFLIGDTPNDIKCAQAIGARCLAVLAGSTYTREQLAECKPWKILDELPGNPKELEQMFNKA